MVNELTYMYGLHAVEEALRMRPDVVAHVYYTAGVTQLRDQAVTQGISCTEFNPQQRMLPGGVSPTAVHQGVIAALDVSRLTVEYKTFMENYIPTPESAVVILGEVQDPHNVGAIVRSAAAFGLAGVLIPPHRQAPVTATVLKVSAGMAFQVPLVEIVNVNTTIRDLKEKGFWVYGLAGEAEAVSVSEETFDRPACFVVGNEGDGLRAKTRDACDTLLKIPMHPRCESLNASVAAAVIFQNWSQQHPGAMAQG